MKVEEGACDCIECRPDLYYWNMIVLDTNDLKPCECGGAFIIEQVMDKGGLLIHVRCASESASHARHILTSDWKNVVKAWNSEFNNRY